MSAKPSFRHISRISCRDIRSSARWPNAGLARIVSRSAITSASPGCARPVASVATAGRVTKISAPTKFTGYDANGGYADYAVVREDFAYALPATLDPVAAAPLLCAGIIGYRALRRAEVKPGCRLGLFGFGSSASIAIQVARHWGCSIYVMTRDLRHQNLAREMGANWVGAADANPPELLDSAILFAPVGDLVPPAMEKLDRGGTLAIAGIYLTDIPPLNYDRHLFHEKTLRSVTANTRKDGEELLKIAAEIPLKPETETFPLAETNRALQLLKHDAVRGSGVVIVKDSP